MLTARVVSPTTDHPLPTTDHRLPATGHRPPPADHRPPTIPPSQVLQSSGTPQLSPASLTQLVVQLPQTYAGDPALAAALTELAIEHTMFPDGECAKQFYRRNMRLSVLEFMEEVRQEPTLLY